MNNEILVWAAENEQMTICGHTHKPVFPGALEVPYYNTGSCVHPRCITGIEIADGWISLIKWSLKIRGNGVLAAEKEVLEERDIRE